MLLTVDLNQLLVPAFANRAICMQSIQEEVNYFQYLLGNRFISTVTRVLQRTYIRRVEGWMAVTTSQFTTHAINLPFDALRI